MLARLNGEPMEAGSVVVDVSYLIDATKVMKHSATTFGSAYRHRERVRERQHQREIKRSVDHHRAVQSYDEHERAKKVFLKLVKAGPISGTRFNKTSVYTRMTEDEIETFFADHGIERWNEGRKVWYGYRKGSK